jgi:hypothetical protein
MLKKSAIKQFLYVSIALVAVLTPLRSIFAQEIFESEPFSFRSESDTGLTRKLIADPFSYIGEPIAFGSFRIWPNVTFQQEYTDNVLAVEDNAQSDFVTVAKPSIKIWKNIGRHDFMLQANLESRRHWDRQDDDVANYNFAFNGNLEAKKGINIPMQVIYRDAHLKRIDQRRSNPNQIIKTPLNVKFLEIESGVDYKPNRLGLSLLGKYEQIRLGNESLVNGGFLTRDNRNVNITEANGRVSYSLKNGLDPFAQLTYSHENYINEKSGAVNRNNNLLKALSGVEMNYKGLVKGFLGVGVENRLYDDATVSDTNDISFDAQLAWEPRAKTQFLFEAKRETAEDNILISGLTKTNLGVGVRHELNRDVFGRVFIRYENSEFNELNRTDDTTEVQLEVLKIINARWQMSAGYTYTSRDSSVLGLSLDNNAVFVRGTTAF